MDVIDERGRVFGVVNVVDLLAVLVVVAVLVAGVALVLGSDSDTESAASGEPLETRYVTLELGELPVVVAEAIGEGDTIGGDDGPPRLEITDVYLSPTVETNRTSVRVLARVAVRGKLADGTFQYRGEPLRLNRDIDIVTDEYAVTGVVRRVGADGPELDLVGTDVLLRTTLPAETAESIEVGDTYRRSGQTIATVESVEAFGTETPDVRLVYVGVTYTTPESSAGPQFAGQQIRTGAELPFETDGYSFEGTTARVGALEQRGEPATRTVTLELTDLDPDRAGTIEAGMAERIRGESIAEVTNLDREPSTVEVTTGDGEVVLREHPTRRDVTLTTELRVRRTDTGLRFKGQPLRQGETITLDLGTVTIEPTVVRLSG